MNIETVEMLKGLTTEFAAILILIVGVLMSLFMVAMPEYMSMAFGSAISFLFIKHSPNTL